MLDLINSYVLLVAVNLFELCFQDGSYSRGPVEIPVGEYDESKYFYSPTFKFEQASALLACMIK
jgi:hypothetical protein